MANHIFTIFAELIQLIKEGRKTLELRIANRRYLKVRVGDFITLRSGGKVVQKLVVAIYRYHSLDEAITNDNVDFLWPGHSREEVLLAARKYYGHWKGEFLMFSLT